MPLYNVAYKAQSKKDKEFLELWRDLENACKDEGPLTVLELEKNLDARSRTTDVAMLRMCRVTRNFMVHDGCGFIEPTPAMCLFLQNIVYEVKRVRGTVSDHMLTPARYGCVKPDTAVAEAARVMLSKKRRDVLVIGQDKSFLGVLGPRAMAAALAGGEYDAPVQYLADSRLLDPATIVSSDCPAKSAPAHKCVVIDRKEKCAGVWDENGGWS